jgi:hypothetical protein
MRPDRMAAATVRGLRYYSQPFIARSSYISHGLLGAVDSVLLDHLRMPLLSLQR